MSPRTVLVTGASSGIGEAAVLRLAHRGDHLVLLARREEELQRVARACRARGAASARVVVADVADDDAVEAAVATALRHHAQLDGVLHCAGMVTYGRSEETSAEDFSQIVSVNLLGAANLARHVVPVMRRQRAGALVLVGSLLGQLAVPEMTPYVVSKWGVRALARQLHLENLDVPGFRIVHVAPGSVDTPIYGNALDSAGAVNSPPPPVISADRAARTVVAALDTGRRSQQTALTNYALLAAFRTVPWFWDRSVGPAFHLLSRRRG